MQEIEEISECRSCKSSDLSPIISLGNQYVVGFSDSEEKEGIRCPLELVLCNNCKFLQLKHNAPNDAMWGDQYWYKSAINRMIREDLGDIASKAQQLVNLNEGDLVVDIGCNDGTLMENYDKNKLLVAGFEPSKNVAEESSAKGFKVINGFFNKEDFKKEFGDKKAKIITGISMFYDLEDPNAFLEGINEALDDEGIFVIQQNYLVGMLENNAFDNICHEHRGYYSLYSLNKLLDRHNLEVFDVSLNDVNGGSIRTYIRKKGKTNITPFDGAEQRISELVKKEKELRLDTAEPYLAFASRIDKIKEDALNFIKSEKEKGKKICGLGASTRGSVILQYFGLGPEHIDCIFDKNPDKEGKKVVGSWIPITSPDNIDKYNPDYQFVLIWHIFKGIGDDEKSFLNRGGKFLMPLSEFKVIDKLETNLALN